MVHRTYFWVLASCSMLVLSTFTACGDEAGDVSNDTTTDTQQSSRFESDATVGQAESDSEGSDPVGESDATVAPTDTATTMGDDVITEPVEDIPDTEVDDTEEPGATALVETKSPLETPADPLLDSDIISCALYQQNRCEAGVSETCELYDPASSEWVDTPSPLLHRTLLFDRWRDLYNSPDGQAVDRDFSIEVLPGTPESEWGAPEAFAAYWGTGDGGIWTGWSTVASILRYSQTGTEADYQRMEQQVRDMVMMYDVTGIPGYLCRNHYLVLPEGAPNDPEHILRWEDAYAPNHHHRDVPNPASIENLPSIYTAGITDAEGATWMGTPRWKGRPSIDQNTGPMTSLPMAYDMLRDEALKERISHHLTCYLKRLQRIEIINLQSNPDLLEGLLSYFNAGELQLEEDDIDFAQMDRIVGYVHRQINTLNEANFDMSCPDEVQTEPWRVIDAAEPSFLLDILGLVADMDTDDERPEQIDHFYFPTLRGGDAMHMMHLAAIAWHFTGDEMYREFLRDELIEGFQTIKVAFTTGAFNLPKYCKKYYGDQITYGPWWAFIHLLQDGELKSAMQEAFHEELWGKLLMDVRNVDFNIMYAGALSDELAPDKESALTEALDLLQWMGGNGGALSGDAWDAQWLDDPRRSYTLTADQAVTDADIPVEAVCPTDAEYASCTAEIEFMGTTFPSFNGWKTYECAGTDNECVLPDGQCTNKMASAALPPPLRPYTDYLWQRNPHSLGRGGGMEGHRQFAGSDVSVPYWNARQYGFVTEGAGQVLAWRPIGTCEDGD